MRVELAEDQIAALRSLINSRDVPATVATRARIVLWRAEGRRRNETAALAGVSLPTVDRWLARYAQAGVAGLIDEARGAPRAQVPAGTAERVVALTRVSPPRGTGLTHWSTRTLADYLARAEGIAVSWHYVAKVWKDNGLRPHRSGTFKLSRDPAFADRVADVVGLYLDPPGGAVVLCIDEKTSIQALDRTQPLLPLDFDVTEKRTHDYRRHGTTNLFAAFDTATGQVVGDCYPRRTGREFLAFVRKAVKPHAGREVHVVLDNLSTHDTPAVRAWLAKHPHVSFHFTPIGSSWLNQAETWFSIITRQAIRRGTFSSVNALVFAIRDYINSWNADAAPFVWTATADEILAKVAWVQANVKKLVDNNAK